MSQKKNNVKEVFDFVFVSRVTVSEVYTYLCGFWPCGEAENHHIEGRKEQQRGSNLMEASERAAHVEPGMNSKEGQVIPRTPTQC